ncbi:ParB/Srx family N-terminal domain-containing protein [Methylobacterium aquaticum]|uniref:Predicted transcriptional regulators n=1 Tax=Methylobacterium aquaticum TaxID=270351 RepID=A0A0C6FP33_9HYPH|nr:ParB/Srx family N-terminal domain-containing protein [Methylobacterium aquaticum]BAQ44380.1 predicted transcriptional regulators [Methylobacterium aquaticum]
MAPRKKVAAIKDVAAPQVELRDLDDLRAYVRNARTHSREQIEQLKASIREFGWTNAVLADAEGIVAGHARCIAARELHEAGEALRFPNGAPIPAGQVPVVDCTGWTEAQRRAYILADNQLALNAGWDAAMLNIEFGELEALKFDLGLTGFTPAQIEDFAGADDPGAGTGGIEDPPDSAYREQFGVIVMCGSEQEQQRVYEELTAAGRTCKVVTT